MDAIGLLLLLLTILVPVLFGILTFVTPGYGLKKYVIMACALLLSAGSLLAIYGGPMALDLESIGIGGASIPLSPVIFVLDLLLLTAFLYFAVKDKEWKAVVLVILQAIPLLYVELFMQGSHASAPAFVVDNLAIVMCLVVSLIGSLILIYSIGYMKGDKNVSSFFLVMMVFLGDMNALIFANDLMLLFFFWEVTTLCSFLLIRHYRDEASIKASDRALWMNLLGGVALITGIMLIEMIYGTRFLSTLLGANATLPGFLSFLPAGAIVLPFAFLAFGAFTKSALIPFNSWLTGAMVAPTPVSALLHSSTMVNAGVYMLIRIAPFILGTLLSPIIGLIGGFSFMFCALLAMSQTDSKRILAYSTISYLGLIAMCVGINTTLALFAAVALLVFHAVSKGLLFLCVGTITHELKSRNIEDMEGLITKMPLVAVITVIGLISLMAPPFGIFVGKWLAFESASTFQQLSLSMLDIFFIIFGSIFSVFYYARWAGKLLASKPFEEPKKAHHHWYMEIPLVILTVGIFASVALTTYFFPKLLSLPVELYKPIEAVLGPSLTTIVGSFSPLGFLLFFVIIILVPLFFIRVPKKAMTTTWSCGTGVEPELGGGYFDELIGENKIMRYLIIGGIVLLAGLFVAVIL